jgi:hypothetical protein
LEDTTGLTCSDATIIILTAVAGLFTMDPSPSNALLTNKNAAADDKSAPDSFLASISKISPKKWNPHAQTMSQASQHECTDR